MIGFSSNLLYQKNGLALLYQKNGLAPFLSAKLLSFQGSLAFPMWEVSVNTIIETIQTRLIDVYPNIPVDIMGAVL